MCTVLLPPGGYPTAVNKYIIQIITIYCENNMKPINIIYGKTTEVLQLRFGAVFVKGLIDLFCRFAANESI